MFITSQYCVIFYILLDIKYLNAKKTINIDIESLLLILKYYTKIINSYLILRSEI